MDQIREPSLSGHNRSRNPGAPLDPSWFEGVGVNASAVERRASTLTTRRTVKKAWQAAWLVKALTCIDLTTLAGDDTPDRVRRLCAKARRPLNEELLAARAQIAQLSEMIALIGQQLGENRVRQLRFELCVLTKRASRLTQALALVPR